jgi:type II secretory pathway component PulF
MTPLDEKTYRLAAQTVQRARLHGVASITALHQAGLILSDDLARQIRADTITSLAERLRTTRLRHLMPDPERYKREGATPTQTRDAIVVLLEQLADLARKGEFR